MLNGYSNLSQRNHLTLRYCARKSLSLHVLFPSFSFSFFEFFRRVFRRRGKVNHLCWEEFHCETMCLSFSFDVSLSSGCHRSVEAFQIFVYFIILCFIWSKSTSEHISHPIDYHGARTQAVCEHAKYNANNNN